MGNADGRKRVSYDLENAEGPGEMVLFPDPWCMEGAERSVVAEKERRRKNGCPN